MKKQTIKAIEKSLEKMRFQTKVVTNDQLKKIKGGGAQRTNIFDDIIEV